MLGLIVPGCALLPSQAVLHTGQPVFWWVGPMVMFIVIPVVDALVGENRDNPPEEAVAYLAADRFYRWCTYLFLPILLAGLGVAGYLWANGTLTVVDKIGLAVSVGLVSGVGINAAHELGHRVEKHERWLAKVALAQSGYGHFFVEHNRGHHVHVATPADPASSRFGESLWAFLPRSVVGGFRSAWRLERDRLARQGRGVLSVHNNILQAWAMSAVLFGALIAAFGAAITPYLILQAVVAFGLLEAVNYVEHYGLLRERRADGRYERCSPRHSWNSDRLVTNIFLFHLQRHSDHHANPGRRYQTLRSFAESPQLPAGYATMVLLAMFPPLWRRVMDPRVLAHYGGDLSKVHRRGVDAPEPELVSA
ncbi:alkane 1-monooxygenase [Skermania sp. ID1734]|nr:alkane 1-monooxygenase [Skermania sp. ID1734]